MNAMKKCIKNFEILSSDSLSSFIKRITTISKIILPKSMLRGKEDK